LWYGLLEMMRATVACMRILFGNDAHREISEGGLADKNKPINVNTRKRQADTRACRFKTTDTIEKANTSNIKEILK
ncbi:MAG: hypothetical protein QG663_1043, partial [Thermodesulfobacteriota bacterium]|nr:hypothetical protein [Thermodesulfobacteriota bacterium]